jgi:hypothetical protein
MARDYAKMIGALIANAEDETLPQATRDSYRNKAESLMREYRIAEEDAIATEGSTAVPVMDQITIMETHAYDNPLRSYYWMIMSHIANHCGIRVAGQYEGSSWGESSKLVANVVGYEGDLKYAELLFLAARLVFLTRIDARVDRSLSDQLNCYYMRGSGMSRKDIAEALWGSSPTDGAAHGKVQKLYVAECTARGEVPKVSGRGIQVAVYREAYARGFVNEIYWRLDAASSAVDKESGGLVLHGRMERVDEAFYNAFPKHRPMTAEERAKERMEAAEEVMNCADCKKTKHESGRCKRHRPYEISAADRRRQERLYGSAEAHAGMRAGARAAEDVHIGRSGTAKPKAAGQTEARNAIGA